SHGSKTPGTGPNSAHPTTPLVSYCWPIRAECLDWANAAYLLARVGAPAARSLSGRKAAPGSGAASSRNSGPSTRRRARTRSPRRSACCPACWSPPWTFPDRTRRPPTDPVKPLLSLGYTWLLGRVTARVEAAGYEPSLGGLHDYRPGRPSLGCDLIEPLRVPAV